MRLKRPSFKGVLRGLILAVALPLFALMIYLWRTDWVPAGYVGVIYDANSGLQANFYKPGAVWIGWRQQMYVYPTRLQAAIYTEDPTAAVPVTQAQEAKEYQGEWYPVVRPNHKKDEVK